MNLKLRSSCMVHCELIKTLTIQRVFTVGKNGRVQLLGVN